MRFVNKYVHARYSPRVPYYETHGPHRQLVHGLIVQFEDNEFDSEAAQHTFGWTDEERVEVEEYLQAHRDYGRVMNTVSAGEVEGITTAPPELITCLWMVTIDGDVEVCGRPAVNEEGECAKHAAMAEAPQHKPNRPAAKASA